MIGLYRKEGTVNLPDELFFCFSAGLSPRDKMRIRTGKRAPHDIERQMEVNKKSEVSVQTSAGLFHCFFFHIEIKLKSCGCDSTLGNIK